MKLCFLWGKKTQSSQKGQQQTGLQMAKEHLSTPPAPHSSCCIRPAAAKPFLMGWEEREKQHEVRAPFKDRHRSKGRRGREKWAMQMASTRRERPGATNYWARGLVASWPGRLMTHGTRRKSDHLPTGLVSPGHEPFNSVICWVPNRREAQWPVSLPFFLICYLLTASNNSPFTR